MANQVMGIALFLYSFNSIQSGLLQRKMMFQTMFVRSLLATPISAVIGITMAYLGVEYGHLFVTSCRIFWQ